MLLLKCVHCGRQFNPGGSLAGREVLCPGCGRPLRVPTLSGADQRPGEQTAVYPPTPARLDTLDAPPAAAGLPALAFLRPPEADDEAGRLGGYRVLGVLGSGGMGVVFRAEDPLLHRPAALKVMRPEFASDPDLRERFLREARAAAAVYHDHVVPVWQVGEDNGVPFLVMPLLEGEPLGRRLVAGRPEPLAEVLRVGREMAEGLAAAHAKGMAHRDIKPDNVWLEGEAGRVRLLDFGLARANGGPRLTRPGSLLGTPAYMAPEQARGQADGRSDLFALGCVLFEMASGRRAFPGEDTIAILTAVALDTPPDLRTLNPEVPAGLASLVAALLSKSPDGRPASAAAVAGELRRLAGGGEGPRPAPRRWWPAAVAVGLALLAAGLCVWLWL